jgi:hypothetical protein
LGKDGTDLLATTKKRPNFRTQRDSKIQDRIDRNGLGNRCSIRLSYGTYQRFQYVTFSELFDLASWGNAAGKQFFGGIPDIAKA